MGGYWSTYWYNGYIYGSEIGRGLDVFKLTPSASLSQHEIDAASSIEAAEANPQLQTKNVWPAGSLVARAYLDQLARGEILSPEQIARVVGEIEQAEQFAARSQGAAAAARLVSAAARVEAETNSASADASAADAKRLRMLAASLREWSESLE